MSPKVSQSYIDEKKLSILQVARKVFIHKGYTATTMQDIVDACGISRGGLYLFFPSTEAVFMALLRLDMGGDEDALAGLIGAGRKAFDILQAFVEEEGKSIVDIDSTLLPASYEFFIKMKDRADMKTLLAQRRSAAQDALTKVIGYGISTGEFKPQANAPAVSSFIVHFLEGLIISSIATGMAEPVLASQTGLLLDFLHVQLLKP
jgi:AcrR family transcriptional regulator